jgi:hypothetical protein
MLEEGRDPFDFDVDCGSEVGPAIIWGAFEKERRVEDLRSRPRSMIS